jgi:sulfoxide reductase catalytic subunit YedY
MLVRRVRPWDQPASAATPEGHLRRRRELLRAIGFGALGAALGSGSVRGQAATQSAAPPAPQGSTPAAASPPSSPAASYPARRNPAYSLDRALTEETLAAHHNIFDEFASTKDGVAPAAARLRTSPWKIHVGGVVKEARTFEVAELVHRLGLEERLYRHRCVEAWGMAVPWTGFPLAKLLALCERLDGRGRFVRFVSAARPDEMPGWYASRRVFPYYEALTWEEATHELAFVATGIYGHPLPPQHGAPIRLVLPWKYGFKSAKSIVAIQLTDERPSTFWNALSPKNYSWSANVDPAETTPWPQAQETMLGSEEKCPTLPFNGYGEWVAKLYA